MDLIAEKVAREARLDIKPDFGEYLFADIYRIPIKIYGTMIAKLAKTKLSGEEWIAGSNGDSPWTTKTLVVSNI